MALYVQGGRGSGTTLAAGGLEQTGLEDLATELGRSLLDTASADGLFACSGSGRIDYCNAAAARFLHASPGAVVGADVGRLVSKLGDQTLELRFRSAIRDRAPAEFVVARPGGKDEWVEARGMPITGGIAFLLRDVTERERSERSLRRNEHILRSATDSLRLAHKAAGAATWEWRQGGVLRWMDLAAAHTLLGPAAEAADGTAIAQWRDFVLPDDLQMVDATLDELDTRNEVMFECRIGVPGGQPRWVRASAAVVERLADGRPALVSGVSLDITAQKLTEARLRREVNERALAERRQQLLIHELNHRVKNMLATVQSVARQSLGASRGGGPLADFEDRLMSLAWAHDILTRERWAGASLRAILGRTMAPLAGSDRVQLIGPDLRISPKMALALAMGGHELATNAMKYGALSNETGRVSVRWRLDRENAPGRLILDWQEFGGPEVTAPSARGFGSRLLERGLAHELGGQVTINFDPAGVRCHISAPFQPEHGAPGEELDDLIFQAHGEAFAPHA